MAERVDVASLLMLRELQRPGTPDAVGRIAGRFLEETPERVATLRAAVAEFDPRKLEQAAHALKGIAGTVGANDMREIAQELEQLGRDGTTDGAASLVSALDAALAYAMPIFARLRDGDQGG